MLIPGPSLPSIQLRGTMQGTIHIFYDDSLLTGIATVEDDDDLVLTEELGHFLG